MLLLLHLPLLVPHLLVHHKESHKENLFLMNGVHLSQMNLENASYMENRTPGTIMDLGRLTLFLTQVSLPKTPLQQLPLLQSLLVLHLLVPLPLIPFLLPLLLQKLSGSQLHSRTTKVLLVLLQLRLLKTKQTKFTEFRQTYTIMQQQLKECPVILASSELKNDSLPYSAPEVARIQTIVLVVMHVN